MKCFLFPVLALAITACGNNGIVVTSKVGEKIIVERDTIQFKQSSEDNEETIKKLIDFT